MYACIVQQQQRPSQRAGCQALHKPAAAGEAPNRLIVTEASMLKVLTDACQLLAEAVDVPCCDGGNSGRGSTSGSVCCDMVISARVYKR
jgi:hypothetical protein